MNYFMDTFQIKVQKYLEENFSHHYVEKCFGGLMILPVDNMNINEEEYNAISELLTSTCTRVEKEGWWTRFHFESDEYTFYVEI